jgi:uncharacterized protein with FMN-binding domain
MNSNESSKKTWIVGSVIGIAVIGSLVAWAFGMKDEGIKQPQRPVGEGVTPEEGAQTSAYADGEYTATGVYSSPAGPEELEVKVVLAGGTITSTTVVGKATNPASQRLQNAFIESVNAEVVGKSIDEVNLGVVSGASLTPKGFNDAIAKIKVQAAAQTTQQ